METVSLFERINTELEPELDKPAPEKVISGDPSFKTWNCEETDDGIYAGIWEATPGKWHVQYDEWEFCHILSGVSIIHEANGTQHRLEAGDSFVLRRGLKAIWEVVETTRKEYVIKL